ncbi:MAG: tRNA 2-selenouridine(34) synthase MnmH [Pseudomonadota bacterium]
MTRLPKKRPDLSDLQALLAQAPALLDVRAPIEFAQGAIPGSINLPILNDEERAAVGTAYREQGGDAATRLGHELVSGPTRMTRLEAWQQCARAHPDLRLICWRGGSRSAIAQQWLRDAGTSIERVSGGYKALRNACLHTLEEASADPHPWWVIAGKTGVAKTVAINRLPSAIDLEGLAHHRGSAFGAYPEPQPAPASFENALACAYLRVAPGVLVLEDESRTIGRIGLPEAWYRRMQQAPLAVIDATLDDRVAHIEMEYVSQPLQAGRSEAALAAHYLEALRRIRRRLGGALHQDLHAAMTAAFAGEQPHAVWIRRLLEEYYDPMYEYQLAKKQDRIRFSGSLEAVLEYLEAQQATTTHQAHPS